jgi:uncharacterized membrane protein
MRFLSLTAVAVAAMLSVPALSCKCFVNGNADNGRTESCCNDLHGVFRFGNDCAASSISEHLSNFRRCCGGQSDCDYPKTEQTEGLIEEESFLKTIVVIPTAAAQN